MSERTPETPMLDVGKRLRAIREQRGLSLRGLAEQSGLSVNAISLIERGVNSPTVASLQVLAAALGVPITEFFRQDQNQTTLYVKRADRARYQRGGMDIESLGAGLRNQQIEPFLMTIRPGEDEDPPALITHSGQEFIYCVEGQIDYQVGDQVYRLEAGDALLFEADQPHRCLHCGTTEALVLLVFSAREGQSTGRAQHLRT